MKKSKIALRLISLALTFVLIFSVSGLSVFAVDESDYVAEFRIETDKSTVKKGEDVEVSVFLKADYYISSVSLVVIYNCQAFTLQNTSNTSPSSFLSFSGQLAQKYFTNGNWRISDRLFASRNSRSDYWSHEKTLEKYKAVYATWASDSSRSYYLTKLSEEEKIVSFTLKANEDIEDLSELIFINMDFLKTSNNPQGAFFVGRSTSEGINLNNIVSTGQTIIYKGVDPTVNDEIEHIPGEAVTENLVLPDCENKGSYDSVIYCTFCGDEISRETMVTEALGHKYDGVVTAPDCVNDGYTTYTCLVCSDSYTADTTAALGHTEGEAVEENRVAADCVNDGSYETVVYCTACDEELSRETIAVDAPGHVPGRIEIIDATTEADGSKTTYCSVCDEVISVEVIEKIELSISPSEGKETVIDTENKVIYGLETGIDSLDSFVTTQGYTLKYTYHNDSFFGTGTRVDCIYNGEIKETYYVVIFGDLTGDGVVDIYDSSVVSALVNGDMEFDEDSAFDLASDLNNDTVSDIYDLAIINSVVNGETDISQILK